PQPSNNDCLFTERMKQAGEILGIELLDHLIVTSNSYYSFREEGTF
ncbi:JAB domain-containing protein, partial [Enterococcus faecalis]